MLEHIRKFDPQLASLVDAELERQRDGLVMIPSENFASPAVLEAAGTVLTNKYAEGYPGRRYYSGNQYIDQVEQLAIDRAKLLFQAEHANVQPNAGSTANMACFMALLNRGDKVLGMDLAHGGHLTHGSPVNFSGQTYNFVAYGVERETEMLDMDKIRKIALAEKPKLVLSGHTAYPRKLNFTQFFEIAQEVGAYAMADISHIVGLCLAGEHENPVPSHDVVMTTTHKTLRGTRSALILCKKEDRLKEKFHAEDKWDLAQRVDRAVFPGLQGGPLEHLIAAKAVMLKEAMLPEFAIYQKQIVKNAKALAEALMSSGLRLVSGGTDNHLMIIDCTKLAVANGKKGSTLLEAAQIYTNMSMIPFDTGTPLKPSGIRLGTPALTTRGMKESEMKEIGALIATLLQNPTEEKVAATQGKVRDLTSRFPLYPELK